VKAARKPTTMAVLSNTAITAYDKVKIDPPSTPSCMKATTDAL